MGRSLIYLGYRWPLPRSADHFSIQPVAPIVVATVDFTHDGASRPVIATEAVMTDKGNGIAGTTCIALAVAGLALTASLVLAYYATRARVEGLRAGGG